MCGCSVSALRTVWRTNGRERGAANGFRTACRHSRSTRTRVRWRRNHIRTGDCIAHRRQRRKPPVIVNGEQQQQRHRFQVHSSIRRPKIKRETEIEREVRKHARARDVCLQITPRVGSWRGRSAASGRLVAAERPQSIGEASRNFCQGFAAVGNRRVGEINRLVETAGLTANHFEVTRFSDDIASTSPACAMPPTMTSATSCSVASINRRYGDSGIPSRFCGAGPGVDDEKIGGFPDFDRADLVVPAHRCRRVNRHHLDEQLIERTLGRTAFVPMSRREIRHD